MEHIKTLTALAGTLGTKVWRHPSTGEERVYINFGIRRNLGEKAFIKDEGGIAGLQLVIVGAGHFRREREQAIDFELAERGIRI